MVQIILAARGRITTHFKQDIGRGFLHRGIDQGHGNGNAVDLEIRAPADGVITYAGVFGSYGLCYFIKHDDGWVSVLAHHKSHLFTKGDRVSQRQLIATMGNSGTKYVHSHEELRDARGNQVDPLLHLGSATASGTTITLEEDDMNEQQNKWLEGVANTLGTLNYMVANQIKPQTDKIELMANAVGVILWATTDNVQGLRKMVGNLTELVAKLDGGELAEAELKAALAEALAPMTSAGSIEEIAKAVADENDFRARARLNA